MKKSTLDIVSQLLHVGATVHVTAQCDEVDVFEMLAELAGKKPTDHIGAEGPYRSFDVQSDSGVVMVLCRRGKKKVA